MLPGKEVLENGRTTSYSRATGGGGGGAGDPAIRAIKSSTPTWWSPPVKAASSPKTLERPVPSSTTTAPRLACLTPVCGCLFSVCQQILRRQTRRTRIPNPSNNRRPTPKSTNRSTTANFISTPKKTNSLFTSSLVTTLTPMTTAAGSLPPHPSASKALNNPSTNFRKHPRSTVQNRRCQKFRSVRSFPTLRPKNRASRNRTRQTRRQLHRRRP